MNNLDAHEMSFYSGTESVALRKVLLLADDVYVIWTRLDCRHPKNRKTIKY